ncbi:MAG: Lacal_2735 family protein [Planctomycetota bacterium]
MFGLFQSKKDKLEKKYAKLLEEAYKLSHVDRQKSDMKQAEADELRKEIDALDASA